jgi:hypothetical protein
VALALANGALRGDAAGVPRAAAIVAGFGLAAAGYVTRTLQELTEARTALPVATTPGT